MNVIEKIKGRLPVSRQTFHRESDRLFETVVSENEILHNEIKQIYNQTERMLVCVEKIVQEQSEIADRQQKALEQTTKELMIQNEKLENALNEGKTTEQDSFAYQKNMLTQMLNLIRSNRRYSEEIVWANVFHDATNASDWMHETNFTPGRWAIGYQTLYVLYRILNEIKPSAILELGLGQSTKMISQYVDQSEGVCHKVVEHDANWIENYKKINFLSAKTEILLKELGEGTLDGVSTIRTYEGFEEGIMPAQYDLIIVDAPWGGDMKTYSRVDVAQIMPGCLKESFVILMDDYNRVGEQETIEYMKRILEENNLEYAYAKYEGAKDLAVLASKDLEWACTF